MLARERRVPRYALQPSTAPRTPAGDYVRARFRGVRGGETAARLMEGALADSTRSAYGKHFAAFATYCEAEGLSALPADVGTVVAYVGYLADLGTWAEESMQPIFSGINGAHLDLGFEAPARGSHFLTRVRQGLRRAQAQVSTRDTRIPLPASVIISIIEVGESAGVALAKLRDATAISLCALFSGRQDSAVHLRSRDIGVDDEFIWLRLEEKGKRGTRLRRVLRIPLDQPPVRGHASAVPRVASLVRRFRSAREAAAQSQRVPEPEFFFQLPSERARPTTRSMEGWLAGLLTQLGVAAPRGFAYQGHSIRSLGASANAAIGVARHIYHWTGGWQRGSQTVEKHYVDPTVLPTAAAYALYGWALTRSYAADAAVTDAADTLEDPLAAPADAE